MSTRHEALGRGRPEKIRKGTMIMPYFVYKISPPRLLEHLDTVEQYQQAREIVRDRRKSEPRESGIEYRLIFARQQGEAEKFLSVPRDTRVIGED